MRKFFAVGAAILFMMAITGGTVFAQDSAPSDSGLTTEKMVAPIPPGTGMPPQLFGQNQSYSVVFRGNGEAVVNARVTFTNTGSSLLASLGFRVPKVEPKDVLAFQVVRTGPCVRYAPEATAEVQNMLYVPTCLQYDEPQDPYAWYGPAKYQKAATQYEGDTLTITLPQPIKPEKFGSILLYYHAFGYAKKDIVGTYQFSFETLQATEPVEQVDVGITTDTNLRLRGTQDKVNYRFENVGVVSKGMTHMAAPAENTRLDSYYQQIGTGQLIKSASNLQPLESFTVRGSYADNLPRLYAKEIAIGMGVFVVIVLLTVGVLRIAIKVLRTQPSRQPQPAAPSQTATILVVVGLSFLSAVFIVGYTVAVIFITRSLSILLNYDYTVQLPIVVVLSIISLGVYGFLLVAPAIFVSMKRGSLYGLITAGLTLGWVFLAAILFAVITFVSGNPPYPVPLDVVTSKFNGGGAAETQTEMQAQPAMPD